MLGRYSEDARQVVTQSQQKARDLKHNYIGGEHILLGLTLAEGDVSHILRTFDVTSEKVEADILQIVGLGEEVRKGQIPFTPRTSTILKRAEDISLEQGASIVAPEHVLLSLLHETEGTSAKIFQDMDVEPRAITEAVLAQIRGDVSASMPCENDAIGLTIMSSMAGDDPEIPIFHTELQAFGTISTQTFGSPEFLEAYLQGLNNAYASMGYLTLFSLDARVQLGQPSGVRFMLSSDKEWKREDLNAKGEARKV